VREIDRQAWPHLASLARTAAEARPADDAAWRALAGALKRAGDAAGADAALAQAAVRAPADAAAAAALSDGEAQALFAERDYAGLAARCRAELARRPGAAGATHWLLAALAAAGEADAARRLLPLAECVFTAPLAPPPDQPDLDAFLAAAAAEVLRHPTLAPDPAGKATRSGLQTGSLRRGGAMPTIEQLLEAIAAGVDALVPRLGAPVLALAGPPPARAQLSAWAVVTGPEGRQASHHHPRGWMSGVVYLSGVRAAGGARWLGPLVLGQLGAPLDAAEPPWGLVEIEPAPGRLVLFPSCAPHATRPTGAPGQRIAVAFDVIPA
jgi:hypothetical protein